MEKNDALLFFANEYVIMLSKNKMFKNVVKLILFSSILIHKYSLALNLGELRNR